MRVEIEGKDILCVTFRDKNDHLVEVYIDPQCPRYSKEIAVIEIHTINAEINVDYVNQKENIEKTIAIIPN